MADRKEAITEQRLIKLSRIRSHNIDPYPPRYHRTHTAQEAVTFFEEREGSDGENTEVAVAGRIVALRSMGKATFLDLRDASGKIQGYLRKDRLGEEQYRGIQDLDVGDIIGVSGRVFRTKSGEITVEASDFAMLAKSLLPLPEKWHGLADVEKRYRQRYLDLVSNEDVRRIFRLRSRVIASIRAFMDGRGFIEVETPVLLPVAAGAMARPFPTYHNALEQNLYLRIALELYLKRLIIGGMDKVYEIGRIFRNEGISIKHNPEFTMLESYEAYADYGIVMSMVEEMVSHVAGEVIGGTEVEFGGDVIDLSPAWQRVQLRDVLREKCGIDFLDEGSRDLETLKRESMKLGVGVEENITWGRLIDKLFSTFVEPTLIQPTFVLDFPAALVPLARRKKDDPDSVDVFELVINGTEVAPGYSELNDPLEQRRRFQEQAAARPPDGGDAGGEIDEDFLEAMESGMPPAGGAGIGIDRLVMILTGAASIRDVILFPQLRPKKDDPTPEAAPTNPEF